MIGIGRVAWVAGAPVLPSPSKYTRRAVLDVLTRQFCRAEYAGRGVRSGSSKPKPLGAYGFSSS
jgi:hypothetical protein